MHVSLQKAPALGLKILFQILLDTSGLSKYGFQVGDIKAHYLLKLLWLSLRLFFHKMLL